MPEADAGHGRASGRVTFLIAIRRSPRRGLLMADILPVSPEQAVLRRAVRQIADKYGHRYFVECATSHKEPTELYGELGAGGYGLADLWFLARMLRTAPTSREMVLNFLAQHSLRLPESY
jgi:hypothetical protein